VNRNRARVAVGGVLLLAVVTASWAPWLTPVIVVASVLGAIVAARRHPRAGRVAISIDCQRCGAHLTSHVGVPERVCRQCGHAQAWANWS